VAPPGPAGAGSAFATKPAPKVGGPPLPAGFGPGVRGGAAPPAKASAPAANVAKPAPAPAASSSGAAAARADSTDEIDIDVDDGRGGRSNGSAIEIDDGGLADAESALEAMQSFRLAEAALQRNDLANAQKLAQKAVDGDPTQFDYITLLAWIRSLANTPQAIEAAINTMTEVLAEDPSSERALLYRGKLHARTNRLHEALADFNEVLSSNPQNRDAANEARLIKSKLG
jgi:tetratricopeptide (TPR) repeat protein